MLFINLFFYNLRTAIDAYKHWQTYFGVQAFFLFFLTYNKYFFKHSLSSPTSQKHSGIKS